MAKNTNSKNTNTLIAILVFAIVLIALVNFAVTFLKVSEFRKETTGFASLGYVNLSIVTRLEINVTQDTIDWGAGAVDAGMTNATLYTVQTDSVVENGNWSKDPDAIVIRNDGSINITLKIQGEHDAAELFGHVGEQRYEWNVTNKEEGSCTGTTSEGIAIGAWWEVNKSQVVYCGQFDYNDNRDEVYLDVKLTVPYNTTNQSVSGTYILETITVTGDTAS